MNKHTMKTEWIDRERVETVIIDVDLKSAQMQTKHLYLYLKNKSSLNQKCVRSKVFQFSDNSVNVTNRNAISDIGN